MGLTFKQKMALALIPIVGGLIALATAIVNHSGPVTPAPGPLPTQVAQPTYVPQLTYAPAPVTDAPAPVTDAPAPVTDAPAPVTDEVTAEVNADDPPYLNASGDRVDENGHPCGNGKYGHSYNGAQACWVP
jgi:hypothetical protein